MHAATSAGLLKQWRYATEGPGVEAYYTLAPESQRLLSGATAQPPKTWGPVGIARQHHTRCLGDFRVHTTLAAKAGGFTVAEYYRENSLRLEAAGQSLYPDGAFTLLAPGRPPLRFFVELDNGTEPLASPRERDSWQKKLAFYETLQDTCGYRFRVLGVITRTTNRLQNVLATAAAASHNPRRPLFYGIVLTEYLGRDQPLTSLCFRDHRGQEVALVPVERRGQAGAA